MKLGNIANSTLWHWVRQGLLPAPIRFGPQAVGWYEDELDAWLAARPRTTSHDWVPTPPGRRRRRREAA